MRIVMTVLVMAALGVSACGKKGALQPPPAQGETAPQPRPFF